MLDNLNLSSFISNSGMPSLSSLYPEGAVNWSLEQAREIASYGKETYNDLFHEKLTEQPKSAPPILVYPSDLGNSEEYQFSVRFDIYETGGLNLRKERFLQDLFATKAVESVRNANGSVSASQFLSLFGAAATPAVEVLGVQNFIQPIDNISTGRDSYVTEQLQLDNLTEHVATVYLYLPGTLNFGYKMDYQDTDKSSLEIGKLLRSLTETQTEEGGAMQAEIARKLGFAAVRAADSVSNLFGGSDSLIADLQLKQRQIENPFTVHLFKGVGRRSFKFSFNMIPRSYSEAVTIDNITRIFRQYAHPKRSSGGRFLDFPAEVGVSFLYQNKENIRLPKIRKCAITGINLIYGENTFTTTKPDPTGVVSPTKVTLELELSELEILTQQSITEQGA